MTTNNTTNPSPTIRSMKICKLCGTTFDTLKDYSNHIDISHNFNFKRKYDDELLS